MIFPKKIIIAFFAGAIALGALINFQLFTKHYFTERQTINEQINAIELAEKMLDTIVLRSGFFLYINQDDIIDQINTVNQMVDRLEALPHVSDSHPLMTKKLKAYREAFGVKANTVYDFQTANAAIKNATMAIPALKLEAIRIFDTSQNDERLFLEDVAKVTSSVLLAKNSLDGELVNNIEEEIARLESYRFKEKQKQDLNAVFIRNLIVFRNFFPQYKITIEKLENSDTHQALQRLRDYFYSEDQTELVAVKYFSYLLVALYFSSLGLIIYFLIRSEKDAITDRLTGLGNRKGYERRIQSATDPVLILVNINKFKNYNDFYGIASGDLILKQTAQRLKTICIGYRGVLLYRLGGDEFGILMDHAGDADFETIGRTISEAFQKETMSINNIEITLSISIAVSTQMPLLETADMALKSIKKDRVKEFILYHEGLNLLDVIKTNIDKTHELTHAVKNDRLIPHFQPIVSLQTSEVVKYEALGRLVTENDEIQSIGDYLDVVKESKHYPTLTRMMIHKSFEIMKDVPYEFSINLSIEDVADEETVAMIKSVLERSPQIASRVIFEILESEAVSDYRKISEFIEEVKRYGCKIAVDDFGSGYSNFAHILNLDIDFLKLDSSLIRYLNINPNAVMIVETIVGFAKKANIKTVAEYVSEKAILDILRNLGVDYAQGFYIGMPGPFEHHNGPFCLLNTFNDSEINSQIRS